jgi:hypothetical protein
MNRATRTRTARTGTRRAAKITLAGAGVAGVAGIAVVVGVTTGAAYAGDAPEAAAPSSAGYAAAQEAATAGQTDYSFEAYRGTLGAWESIYLPSMTCPSGWLQDTVLSQGAFVPRGVQVIAPGGVDVTIPLASKSSSGEKTDLGTDVRLDGTDWLGNAGATNWDPFTTRELIINLHCTTDPGKAATEFVPRAFGG